MGTTITQIIRIYPKEKSISSVDCHKICDNLAKTAIELDNNVIYNINNIDNCLDIKINSRKGTGELGVDLDQFYIWKLVSNSVGTNDVIKNYNVEIIDDYSTKAALFSFDEIRIIGNQIQLKDFYENIYDKSLGYWNHSIDKPIDNVVTLKISGVYTACNECSIGTEHSLVPIQVDPLSFHKLEGDSALINTVLFEDSGLEMMDSFLNKIYYEFEYSRLYKGLNSIEFYNKNRIVKRFRWKEFAQDEGSWVRESADWWDNCLNPEFIEFKTKYKLEGKYS